MYKIDGSNRFIRRRFLSALGWLPTLTCIWIFRLVTLTFSWSCRWAALICFWSWKMKIMREQKWNIYRKNEKN